LNGEDSQTDEDERRRRRSLKDDSRVVERDDTSDSDGLEDGKEPEEDDIRR
jgi:hypothetical protein